jgi:hypothetical protein
VKFHLAGLTYYNIVGMEQESRVAVVYEGKEFGVVLRVEGLYVDKVKELVLKKLKETSPSVFGNELFDVGWLTLKTAEGSLITDKRMPRGQEFLATLVRNPGMFLLCGGKG